MKNNILLNPFAVLSDKKQTIIAITSVIIGTLLSYLLDVNIQVLRINPLSALSFIEVVIDQVILISFLTFTFFGIGKIINKKTRLIDIFNGICIAFIPIYISLFQNINNFLTNEINAFVESMKNIEIYSMSPPILLIVVAVLSVVLYFYFVYLLFIGFKTATNSKKAWHYVLFFATLIITDLITSYIINSI